ncbi:MAG: hypothetical protein AB7V62_16280 [Thermoleophilia bacterium]
MSEAPPAVSRLRREVTTMVLYVCVVLMATIAAVPEDGLDEAYEVMGVLWGGAVGLAVAHWFSFNAAAQLYSGGRLDAEDLETGFAQAAAALLIATVCTVPLFLSNDEWAAVVSIVALAAIITTVGYVASRHAGLARHKAVLRAALTLAAGILVAFVKLALGH